MTKVYKNYYSVSSTISNEVSINLAYVLTERADTASVGESASHATVRGSTRITS